MNTVLSTPGLASTYGSLSPTEITLSTRNSKPKVKVETTNDTNPNEAYSLTFSNENLSKLKQAKVPAPGSAQQDEAVQNHHNPRRDTGGLQTQVQMKTQQTSTNMVLSSSNVLDILL